MRHPAGANLNPAVGLMCRVARTGKIGVNLWGLVPCRVETDLRLGKRDRVRLVATVVKDFAPLVRADFGSGNYCLVFRVVDQRSLECANQKMGAVGLAENPDCLLILAADFAQAEYQMDQVVLKSDHPVMGLLGLLAGIVMGVVLGLHHFAMHLAGLAAVRCSTGVVKEELGILVMLMGVWVAGPECLVVMGMALRPE